ncbi:hypothetical protein RRG08_009574 [Elysia crispata]|uniref:Uncharacterized protein n=1 Tax=Elysia crispata TaxID=231223 RepID=A0AAE0XE99_9GAST|nr:hypothetical protein RRG08_009574 [Elysia crispata]
MWIVREDFSLTLSDNLAYTSLIGLKDPPFEKSPHYIDFTQRALRYLEVSTVPLSALGSLREHYVSHICCAMAFERCCGISLGIVQSTCAKH